MNKSRNLQFTRFIAAVLVIFSHSFPLSEENNSIEWMIYLTKGQSTFGSVAVALFFLCGGYLSVKLIQANTIRQAVIKRINRIVPTLMFVTILTIILGALITSFSVQNYFKNFLTYKYLLNGVMILQHELPGVFSNAPYTRTVNGALWTLPLEMCCFIGVCILNKLNLLKPKRIKYSLVGLLIISLSVFLLRNRYTKIETFIVPCIMYYEGTIYFIFKDKIKYNLKIIILSVCVLLGSIWANCMMLGIVFVFPYIMVYFWFNTKQYFKKTYILGNISYTMYLWGFPIQQYVGYKTNWEISAYENFVISIIIDIFMGTMTHVFVEKNFRRKNEHNR